MADTRYVVPILLLFTIYLSGTTQAILPCPQFCDCPSTDVVDCSNRGLTEWPTGVPLTVTTLDLSQNRIRDFTEVQKFHNLKSLNLQANALSDVMSLSSQSLINLNLSSNSLTNDQGLLDRLPKLLTLDMSKNRLSNWYSFERTKPLRVLDISSNDIESSVLKTIALGHLEVLNISNNRLLSLPANMFIGTPLLRTLVMRNCQLKDIDTQAFNGLTSLTVLDMSDNVLPGVDTKALDILPNLGYLGLEQSKMLCDCRADDLKVWIKQKGIRTNHDITCVQPKPLMLFNILTTDMNQFCSRVITTTTAAPPPFCFAPGLKLLNRTNSLIWLKANASYDVIIELHRIGEAHRTVTKLIVGTQPFFVSMDAERYTICAKILNCKEEMCRIIDRELILPTPCPSATSPVATVLITISVMIILYIPAFIFTHRFIFFIGKRLKKKRPSHEAPRPDTLSTSSQYQPRPTNNNIQVDQNYFNHPTYRHGSSDNIIMGKSCSELSQYESRENLNPGPTYEELLPDSESSTSTNLIDLAEKEELVLSPGTLDFKSPKNVDRSQVFGNKYGTPHFNKYVPPEMSDPGNYEDIYDEPLNV